METKALNINENSKENLKKGAALAGAAMAGAGVMVTADIIRGEEDIDIVDSIDDNDTEDKENITYTIDKPRKTIKSRFFDFVRETLGFVKETQPLKQHEEKDLAEI